MYGKLGFPLFYLARFHLRPSNEKKKRDERGRRNTKTAVMENEEEDENDGNWNGCWYQC